MKVIVGVAGAAAAPRVDMRGIPLYTSTFCHLHYGTTHYIAESHQMSNETRYCSFCGKSENEVKNLIEGDNAVGQCFSK